MIEPLLAERLEDVARALLERGFKPPFALLSALPLPKTIRVSNGVFHCFKDDEIPVSVRGDNVKESTLYATSMESYRRLRAQKAALTRWYCDD